MDLPVAPTAMIDLLRAWFFAKDRSIVLAANTCLVGQPFLCFQTGEVGALPTEKMRIDVNGNVGIGLTNPGRKFHIHDTGTSSVGLQINNADAGSTNVDGLFVGLLVTEEVALINYENTDMSFWTNNLQRMTIDNSGDVGIGLSAPGRKFHVHDTGSGAVGMQINNGDTGSANTDGLFLGLLSTEVVSFLNFENTDMEFRTNSAVRLTIDNAGLVGIGIAAPLAKLHVDQSSTTAAIPTLTLDQADISEGTINFIASDRGTGSTAASDIQETVRVEINGVVRRIALYTDD